MKRITNNASCRIFSSDGFTLIELSIVLVIIGLIIGGILTGQDLIKEAARRAQIAQLEKYNTAVNTFRSKYGGVPGDLQLSAASQFGFYYSADCTGIRGARDGNGLIDGYTSSATMYAALMGENAFFWSDLSTAGLIDGSFTGINSYGSACSQSVTTSTVNNYIPAGKLGYNTSLHVYELGGYNWYMLTELLSFNSTHSNVLPVATIPVIDANNIDKKIDDGLAPTGSVVAVWIDNSQSTTTPVNAGLADTATSCYNTVNNNYSISVNKGGAANCSLSFRFQ